MKVKFLAAFVSLLFMGWNSFSQQKAATATTDQKSSVAMTWNKDTPEQEMNDDIKSLSEYGVTISYSDVKRNDKKEITAIKVTYADKNGDKGAMELNNQKPINTIKFFKQGDEVGFGEPANSDFLASADFGSGQDFMKQFSFSNADKNGQSFNFNFPDRESWGQSNSKIIIQNDGKKPLVIQDGKVIEGGDDYSAEELQKIQQDNKMQSFGNGVDFDFDSNDLGDLNEQMQQMQEQLNFLMDKSGNVKPDDADAKSLEEMKKAKEEMQKAKAEMEKTTKELKKAKSNLKTQKA